MKILTHNKETVGSIQMLASMIISGTIGYFVLLTELDSMIVIFFRCIFAVWGLFLIIAAFKINIFKKIKPFDIALIFLGSVTLSFNFYFLFESYQYISIGLSTVTYHTYPFFIYLIGIVIFKDSLVVKKLAWLSIAFTGVILINFNADLNNTNFAIGVIYALLAAMLYSVTIITTKFLKHYPPILIAIIQLSCGAIIFSFFVEFDVSQIDNTQWLILFLIGMLHTAIMYFMLYSAFQKLATEKIAMISYIYPLTAIVVDYLLLNVSLQPLQIFGCVMILIANIAINFNISTVFKRKPVFKSNQCV